MRAALILAGGKSLRCKKEQKALLPLKGKPLLEWVLEAVRPCVDEIILSGDCTLQSFGHTVVKDRISGIGPLAGLQAGFSVIKSEYTFVAGCDMPFIDPKVIAFLFENALGYSCCLPREGEFIEPLCCVYRTRDARECSTVVMNQHMARLLDLVQHLPLPRFVPFEEVRTLDPDLLSFRNINTLSDLKAAESIMEELL
ncbi:MAG: molybdenum cofactor guanylyltransferase [Theionarchaea archaeon]|nr:molybdenum cofactor guanylyltransferase [Theionarchaea archaeon]MBU7040622.1 molybdenum cofactor guanylyltransferase [Theionarchaea archaeon]